MESGSRKLQPNPRQTANLFSILFFGWTIPLFRHTYDKILDYDDVCEPLPADRSKALGDRLERNWLNERKRKAKPSLWKAIVKTFWPEFMLTGILNLTFDIIAPITMPFLLKNLLEHFRPNSKVTRDDALMYGSAILVMTIVPGIASSHSLFKVFCNGTRVKIAICSLIYRKSLQLSQTALSDTAPGKLVNLLSNDVNRFEIASIFVHPMWTSLVMTSIATYILWIETRWAGMFGLLIVFLIVPIQSYTGKLSAVIRFKTALRTDERVRFMDEIISGVQVIKMYAWEKPFARLIAAARRLEIKEILKNAYVRALYMTFNLFVTRMALFCTVLATIQINGHSSIRVSKIFMISYLFSAISFAMCRTFVRGIAEIGEALVSFKRLQMFLEYEEKDHLIKSNSDIINSDQLATRNIAILMKNVTAGWSDDNENGQNNKPVKIKKKVGSYKTATNTNDVDVKPFKLEELNLEIPKGKLVFVIGSVGAGKSTLIQVLLKELPLVCGSMCINGTISYACQESWIFSSTVRQNITFGQPMDRSRYNDVVRCTALKTDFEQLSDGDMTMVGENGTGLSGGQKARINLARAVYRKADIYLIDDPLSAVDTHVQSHLFNNCIGPKGFLARQNATRILITHQVHFLKEADWIIVLKNGSIETQGNYNDILTSGIDITDMLLKKEDNENGDENSNKNGDKKSVSRKSSSASSLTKSANSIESLNSEKSQSTTENKDGTNEKDGMLKELEASSRGKIAGSMLFNYFKSAKQSCILAFLVVSFLLTQILVSVADVWISYWVRQEENREIKVESILAAEQQISSNSTETFQFDPKTWSSEMYTYICGAIMALIFIISLIRSMTFFKFCATASQNLHDTMFRGLISTKMRFFDTNPSGRIMNRFSKDMGTTDEALPKAFLDAAQINLGMIGAISVTIFTNVKFSIVIIIMVVLFWFVRKIYLKSSTNIKRLEGTTKSPVFSHISATLGGLSTIRAFHAEELLRQEFENHQDLNTGTYFMFLGTSSGFGMSLDLMVYVFLTCVIFVFIFLSEGVTGDRVGLAITQSLSLVTMLQWGVRQSAEVTNMLTSAERILEYSQLEPEKQPDVPKKVSSDWPSKGKIEFKNVFYRYAIDHEPVLRGLTFSVKPKEKVSVVGRTGAGKSTLISSVFRLAIVEGGIVIDDVDTSSVDLNVLRSRISIIPQEPTLFSGTLRRNLDPFEEYDDEKIWSALEDVGLKEFVSDANGLQMPVLARGQNFSTGQRQILCLARAILRKNRIIILDEATANVDLRTDEMIQRTIREKFHDSTVITIAHRLYTVIDSDRILVMDAGVAVEFDAPYVLMQNKDSIFRNMVEALGPQEYDRLFTIAKNKYNDLKS